ncbi:hypothetical protein DAI22_03g239950 [Oryza sativa Japonica Group]|nr:hypothetical protein DAI22_03g239950 [Oryza sativa Japonica Group]
MFRGALQESAATDLRGSGDGDGDGLHQWRRRRRRRSGYGTRRSSGVAEAGWDGLAMMWREQENAGATSASRMEIGAGGRRGDGSRGRRARRSRRSAASYGSTRGFATSSSRSTPSTPHCGRIVFDTYALLPTSYHYEASRQLQAFSHPSPVITVGILPTTATLLPVGRRPPHTSPMI